MCVRHDHLRCQTLLSTSLGSGSPAIHHPVLQAYLAQEILGVLPLPVSCPKGLASRTAFASGVYVGSEDLNLGLWA